MHHEAPILAFAIFLFEEIHTFFFFFFEILAPTPFRFRASSPD
jgi:hypothetical protein